MSFVVYNIVNHGRCRLERIPRIQSFADTVDYIVFLFLDQHFVLLSYSNLLLQYAEKRTNKLLETCIGGGSWHIIVKCVSSFVIPRLYIGLWNLYWIISILKIYLNLVKLHVVIVPIYAISWTHFWISLLYKCKCPLLAWNHVPLQYHVPHFLWFRSTLLDFLNSIDWSLNHHCWV
jgi:hypothetical protein